MVTLTFDNSSVMNEKENEKLGNDINRMKKLHKLIYKLNHSNKYVSYSLTLYHIIILCSGLLLLLALSWLFTQSEYHVSIIKTFKMNKNEDNKKSIDNDTHDFLKHAECHNIPRKLRFDCHPEDGASELECTNRGCCWEAINNHNKFNESTKTPLNIPYCFYPPDWKLYEYINGRQQNNDFVGYLKKNNLSSFYKYDLPLIKIESISIDESILRVKISDPKNSRYEPIYPIRADPTPFTIHKIHNEKYSFHADKSRPGFRIQRESGRESTVIFDSLKTGGFIFADQFLQISTLLPSSNIYGLGEHRTNLMLNTDWQLFTFFNKDQPPTENANLYGSHPFYLVIEETGNCHGVLLLNSNAMDIILQPTPALTYRSIGGIFDFYFFMGPTPGDVLRQYSNIIGKPFFPPYWSLGFHLCRFGYGSLNKTIQVWNRTRLAGIPFDTQWNDLDYMDNANDFTYNKQKFKNLPIFVDQLHALGMHYIPLIDPGISASEINGSYPPYDDGIRNNIFIIDNSTGKAFVGKVWNRVSTVWPDFTHSNIIKYWSKMMQTMYNDFKYDGAWIDMNEPSNFYNGHIDGCTSNTFDYPPYVPNVVGNLLSIKTLCMNAKHQNEWHYDIHNTYATFQAHTTNVVLKNLRKNKRPFIVSRGTWIGQGAYAAHWTGDIYSRWHDLKISIAEILAFSLFQIPMVGADICGFNDNTTELLCNRWMQLGAFYPFSRNHNSDDTVEQDPVAMGNLVVKSSKKALMIRYRFLPYLYTLFYRANKFGDTVARPMFIEFVYDNATWNIDTQFLWGSAFMIIPVLDETTTVVGYLPRGIWYDYYTKRRIMSRGENFEFDAPLDTIPILIRGGYILPAQKPGLTTTESRKNNFELLIALDEFECATGELYWDDGESLELIDTQYRWVKFTLQCQEMIMHDITAGSFETNLGFDTVEIMGVTKNVNWVVVNGKNVTFKYDKQRFYLTINNIWADMGGNFNLTWQ